MRDLGSYPSLHVLLIRRGLCCADCRLIVSSCCPTMHLYSRLFCTGVSLSRLLPVSRGCKLRWQDAAYLRVPCNQLTVHGWFQSSRRLLAGHRRCLAGCGIPSSQPCQLTTLLIWAPAKEAGCGDIRNGIFYKASQLAVPPALHPLTTARPGSLAGVNQLQVFQRELSRHAAQFPLKFRVVVALKVGPIRCKDTC